jgi:hypothetical protein
MEVKSELEIFFSYADKDEELQEELEKRLSPLPHVTCWSKRNISPGIERNGEIEKHLNIADIILLLVSPDFMGLGYRDNSEVTRAIERHKASDARVIPILLRDCYWVDSEFGILQGLPSNSTPVTSWLNHDEAFLDITIGIKNVIKELRAKPSKPSNTPKSLSEKNLNIHGAAFPIKKVFSNEYVFTIPLFQRSYAWTSEQAGELLEDLLMFIDDSNGPINEYFLGSIVLIKGDDSDARVVDGQQRLTTLTILLAVLRALLPELAGNLTPFIHQEANPLTGDDATYRLKLRRDKDFFGEYIQTEGGILQIERLDPATLSEESQKNMQENTLLFLKRLRECSEEQLCRLANAIITQCYLVVVSTPSFDSAYRIFSVLNNRGLNLTAGDILKAEILGNIPRGVQEEEYAKKWEDVEAPLGRKMFQDLFADICMIFRKSKLQNTVLTEFREYVRPQSSQEFIDNILCPYAQAFETITKAAYEGCKGTEIVNSVLLWLNQFEHSDWIPPAMNYLVLNQENPAALIDFFTDLERLTAGLMLLRENASKRIERYCQVLRAIDSNQNLYAFDAPLQLRPDEQREILNVFKGDLSPIQGRPLRYVLLRLNSALSGGRAPAKDTIITVEQVLPPSATPDAWSASFGVGNKRNKHVNSLGNMVLLLRKRDPKLQNLAFAEKKQKYLSSERARTPFILTEQVLQAKEWTPSVVEERRRTLVNTLEDIWRL